MALYLVTGGAGFIGSNIVEKLVRQREQVRVLDNLATGKRENLRPWLDRVELVVGDVRDLEVVRGAMAGVDYVLHQAALPSVPSSIADPLTAHEVNVTGTLNVLVAARDARVKRVVLASSCAVYGDNDDLPLRESAAPKPLSPYAATKLAGEVYCQAFSSVYGLSTVCLRYFNVYGPRQDPAGHYAAVIPRFVARVKAGQPPVIYGDGQQTRDFVHVSDIVRANLLACEHPSVPGHVINVASGRSVSLLELVDTLNGLAGTQLSPTFEPERAGDIRHSVGDTEQLVTLLDFRVETPLPEGLEQLMA
jgi:nucleoside-diphosphate-sugar epimerase